MTRRMSSMKQEGYRSRGRQEKIWMECAKNDICMIADSGE